MSEIDKAIISAIEHYTLGMFEEAKSALEGLYQHDPSNPYVLSYLGLIKCFHEEDFEKGIGLCTQALTLDPQKGIFYYNLGKIYYKQQDFKKAFLTFDKGLLWDPGNTKIKSFLNKYERRKYKAFKNLDRENPLNVVFGKLRSRFRRFSA